MRPAPGRPETAPRFFGGSGGSGQIASCEGIGLCEPCRYLESITGRRLLRGLVHRGGLRARLRSNGVIRVGDAIEIIGAKTARSS